MPDQIAAAAMSHPWSSEALLAKAQRYAELMMGHAKDDWRFALWSSFTLELLLRSALARISPALLADNKDWNQTYYALGYSPTKPKFTPRSISVGEVADRLGSVLPAFTPEMVAFSIRHMTTRNEELHTGVASFDDLQPSSWHGSFYGACDVLLQSVSKSLDYLFGIDEATVARTLIQAASDQSAKDIAKTIKQFRDLWAAISDADKATLTDQALVWATRHIGHRVTCPSCGNAAIIVGSPAGVPVRTVRDGLVVEKQHMLPAQFECVACGLKMTGLSYLMAAGLGDGFTGTTTFDAGEIYAQEPEFEQDFNEM